MVLNARALVPGTSEHSVNSRWITDEQIADQSTGWKQRPGVLCAPCLDTTCTPRPGQTLPPLDALWIFPLLGEICSLRFNITSPTNLRLNCGYFWKGDYNTSMNFQPWTLLNILNNTYTTFYIWEPNWNRAGMDAVLITCPSKHLSLCTLHWLPSISGSLLSWHPWVGFFPDAWWWVGGWYHVTGPSPSHLSGSVTHLKFQWETWALSFPFDSATCQP